MQLNEFQNAILQQLHHTKHNFPIFNTPSSQIKDLYLTPNFWETLFFIKLVTKIRSSLTILGFFKLILQTRLLIQDVSGAVLNLTEGVTV